MTEITRIPARPEAIMGIVRRKIWLRRRCRRCSTAALFLYLILTVLTAGFARSQTVSLRSPQVVRGGSTITTLLFRPTDTVKLRWDRNLEDIHLSIGTSPGDFSLRTVRLLDGKEGAFTPQLVNLPVGVYYAVVTNSDATTLAGIQQDAASDPTVEFSAEFKFAIEATSTPSIAGPRGTISTRIPRFDWSSIPGVVAYAVVVSSSPFAITTNPSTGEATVEGINLVWAHLTTATSALYGEPAVANPLVQFPASPLVPGKTYYFTILNSYSKTDGAFLSTVFGSPVSFTLENRGTLEPPTLTFPRNDIVVSDQSEITFRWEALTGAQSYDLALFERVSDSGGTIETQVFSANTSGTSLVIPAREVMRRGAYSWFLIANDTQGAASVSTTARFRYDVDMGAFTFETHSATDGSDLLGVAVTVRSTEGGYNSPNPFVNASSVTFSDSLVVGNYTFTARKDGYKDLVLPVTIECGKRTQVTIELEALPSRITGFVEDGSGNAVNDAKVSASNVSSAARFESSTGFDGAFSIDLTPGTWSIQATRPGYRSSTPLTVSVIENQTLVLASPLVLIDDNVMVSGRVRDESGAAVTLASVVAVNGTQQVSGSTDGNGAWALQLSGGTWTITASRTGYLTPASRTLVLVAGDNLQNIDFTLQQQAARITGRVLGRSAGAATDILPLEGAIIQAVPLAGASVSTDTDNLGRYDLDLGSGSWTLSVRFPGYVAADHFEIGVRPNETVTDVRFTLDATTASVSGRVVGPDASFLSGVTVASSSGPSVQTSAGGTFQMGIPAGPQFLTLSSSGLVPPVPFKIVPGSGDQLAGLEFTMSNGALLEGHILAPSGPVGSATITVSSGGKVRTTTTGEGGFWTLGVEPGTWEIRAEKDRYVESGVVGRTVQPGQHATGIDLTLQPDHVPVSGFVYSGDDGLSGIRIRFSRRGADPAEPARHVTLSRETGFYFLRLTASSTYDVAIEEAGYQRLTTVVETGITGMSTLHDFTIIPSPALATGFIRTPAGHPVVGAEVSASMAGTITTQTLSGPDGGFALSLDAGAVTITASHPGFDSASLTVLMDAGQTRSGIALVLLPRQGTAIFDVRNQVSGNPVAGAVIRLSGPLERTGVTNTSGSATISGLVPGTYTVLVLAAGYVTGELTVTIPEGGVVQPRVDLLPASGSVSGKVINSFNGQSVGDASVRISGSFGERIVLSDDAGAFLFKGLPVGSARIDAFKAGFTTSASSDLQVTDSGQSVIIELDPATASVEGKVINSDTGNPVSAVELHLTSSAGSATATSDAGGIFRFTSLAAGTWVLDVRHPGFRADNVTLNIATGETVMQDVPLRRNRVVMTGKVLSEGGSPLSFQVLIHVQTRLESIETTTATNGSFTVEGLPDAEDVTIETLIQRVGYAETSKTVSIPSGATTFDAGTLTVPAARAVITGSVGVAGATIRAFDEDGLILEVARSRTDGSYTLSDLPGGNVVIQPILAGYTFTPGSRTVTVASGGSATASFTAQSGFAAVDLHVVTSQGAAISGVRIDVSSLDRTIVRSVQTGASGSVFLNDLPLGRTYRAEPVSGVDTFEPAFATLNLATQSQASAVFTRILAASFIRGHTRDDAGNLLADVTVTAVSQTGTRTSTLSETAGYAIGPVPAGTYTLIAERAGFLSDSLEVTLAQAQELTGIDLVVKRRSASISGAVLRNGNPVSGIEVRLSGLENRTTTTSGSGTYLFSDVPLGGGIETAYQVSVQPVNGKLVTRTVVLVASDVGTTVILDEITLAAGHFRLVFDDGSTPLSGLQILVIGEDGLEFQGSTNAAGVFETPATLSAGTYQYALLASDRLVPPSSSRTIVLQDEQTGVERTVSLPFVHTPALLVASDQPVDLEVQKSPMTAFNGQVLINFRLAGQEGFTQSAMSQQGDEFTGTIPPPGGGEFNYFVSVVDGTGIVQLRSTTFSIIPRVSGRLESILITPSLTGARVRTGEVIPLSISLRDGLGTDLSNRILNGEGTVTWAASGSGVTVDVDPASKGLRANLRADQNGAGQVSVRVQLQGVDRTESFSFEAATFPVESLVINATRRRIRNVNDAIPLGVSGISSDGSTVLLGSGVSWSVDPVGAASVLQDGLLTVSDPAFIGPFTVRVSDSRTGDSSEAGFSAFTIVNASTERSFTDRAGAVINLDSGAFPFAGELSLAHPHVPPSKRFVSAEGSQGEITAGERVVRLDLRSDRSLPGDSLSRKARLRLQEDTSLRLYTGVRRIARFDASVLAWQVLESTDDGLEVRTDVLRRLGEYVIVVGNEPLGIRKASVLPTPFSPLIAPLKIGYFLDTPAPPATVTIWIFTVRGELVRRLVENDLQWPGRYGSRSGLREIVWDGRADDGKMARNGRYIIRIEATDRTGTVSHQMPVVLVK